MFWPKLKRFFFRVMIYQIVLLWIAIRLNNIERTSGEYKDKVLRNLKYFGVNNKELTEFLEDPSLIVLLMCVAEAIFAVMGVFGSYWGNLMSTIMFVLVNIIYFNPLLPEYKISLYNTRQELFYNTGIFAAMLLMTFYPEQKEVTQVYSMRDPDEGDFDDEEVSKETEAKTAPKGKKVSKKKVR